MGAIPDRTTPPSTTEQTPQEPGPWPTDHVWGAMTAIQMPDDLAKQASRNGWVSLKSLVGRVGDRDIKVFDMVCLRCKRPLSAVWGKECEAAAGDTDHLMGGTPGRRQRRPPKASGQGQAQRPGQRQAQGQRPAKGELVKPGLSPQILEAAAAG